MSGLKQSLHGLENRGLRVARLSIEANAFMKRIRLLALCALNLLACQVAAAPMLTVTQGEEADLAATYSSSDLIQGLIATELPGDLGWYPANTDPADQLPAFTDGIGLRATGLTGLLSDFPGAGNPAKQIRYALLAPADITELRIFSGNDGRDGRVFHTYTVRYSTNGAQTFMPPIHVQSHASGTLNNASFNSWRVVLSQLTDTTGLLASRVTHLDLDFFAVDNTGGEMRDPFDGINPFTGGDDLFTAAFVSPLVWEVDLLGNYSQPVLKATCAAGDLTISWIGPTNGAKLQVATNLAAPSWQDLVPQPAITSSGNTNTAQVVMGSAQKFFRVKY